MTICFHQKSPQLRKLCVFIDELLSCDDDNSVMIKHNNNYNDKSLKWGFCTTYVCKNVGHLLNAITLSVSLFNNIE